MLRVLQALVRWNGIVTAVSVALAIAGARLVGVRATGLLLAVVASGTFAVYGLDRRAAFSPEDDAHGQRLPPLPVAVPVAALSALAALVWNLDARGRAVILGLGLLTGLYILPLLPGQRRLKDIPYAKIAVVALGWAVATVLLPAIHSHAALGTRLGLLVGYRALFLVPNLLLADWPDREADAGRRNPHRGQPGQCHRFCTDLPVGLPGFNRERTAAPAPGSAPALGPLGIGDAHGLPPPPHSSTAQLPPVLCDGHRCIGGVARHCRPAFWLVSFDKLVILSTPDHTRIRANCPD